MSRQRLRTRAIRRRCSGVVLAGARRARGEGQPDRAGTFAARRSGSRWRSWTAAGRLGRAVGAAISSAIEVQAQVAAARWRTVGRRSPSCERELRTYRETSLAKRIQKNINLLTTRGPPGAGARDSRRRSARHGPRLADVKGRSSSSSSGRTGVPDCKIQGPILAKLREAVSSRRDSRSSRRRSATATWRAAPRISGRGAAATSSRSATSTYPFLADLPVPLGVANHQRYGVSSTPTVVILDRQGWCGSIIPGRMTEAELDLQLRSAPRVALIRCQTQV